LFFILEHRTGVVLYRRVKFSFSSEEEWQTFNFLYDIGTKKGKKKLKTIIKTNLFIRRIK